jgi:hypothetical protein
MWDGSKVAHIYAALKALFPPSLPPSYFISWAPVFFFLPCSNHAVVMQVVSHRLVISNAYSSTHLPFR